MNIKPNIIKWGVCITLTAISLLTSVLFSIKSYGLGIELKNLKEVVIEMKTADAEFKKYPRFTEENHNIKTAPITNQLSVNTKDIKELKESDEKIELDSQEIKLRLGIIESILKE